MMKHVQPVAVVCCLALSILTAGRASCQQADRPEESPGASAEEGRPGLESGTEPGTEGECTTEPERAAEKVPEIEVEVIGKKWGEQSVPSLAPSTAEVISVIPAQEIEAVGETTLADTIQFLPGVDIMCTSTTGSAITIYGSPSLHTRLFTRGDITKGVRIENGGIALYGGGAVRLY